MNLAVAGQFETPLMNSPNHQAISPSLIEASRSLRYRNISLRVLVLTTFSVRIENGSLVLCSEFFFSYVFTIS